MNRIEFLSNQYATKIVQATQNDPIYSTTFDAIAALDTSGNHRYTDWLCRVVIAKKLKQEDYYKVSKALDSFKHFANLLKKDGVSNDINSYENLAKVMSVVLKYEIMREEGDLVGKNEELREASNKARAESVDFFENDEWRIVVPLTQFASTHYGRSTRWCTAATESDNVFNSYSDGKKKFLYIFINKKTQEKFQYSNADSNIANAADDYVDFGEETDNLLSVVDYSYLLEEAFSNMEIDYSEMPAEQKSYMAFIASPMMAAIVKEQQKEKEFEEQIAEYYSKSSSVNKLILCDLFKKQIVKDKIGTVVCASRYFENYLKAVEKNGDDYVLTPLECTAAISGSGWNIKDLTEEQMEIDVDPVIEELVEQSATDSDSFAALSFLISYIGECADNYYGSRVPAEVNATAAKLRAVFNA